MNQICITARFDDHQSARRAADALALVQGGQLRLSLSMGSSLAAAPSPYFQSLFGHPAPPPPSHPSGGCLLQATCPPTLQSFVVGELAALGAQKIAVHTR